MNPELSQKIADILIENLKEALKAVDLFIALAFLCVVFLLMHGLQGDFAHQISVENARAEQRKSAVAPSVNDEKAAGDQKITIPVLGLEANLLMASLVAVALYSMFCIRAAFRCIQANEIAQRLAKGHQDIEGRPEIVAAVLLFPSLATATKQSKISSCVVLALLGYAAWVVMYSSTALPLDTILVSGVWMLVPPVYLAWRIWGVPRSDEIRIEKTHKQKGQKHETNVA